jgi:outer membrane protein assembly factor BamB
MRLHAALALTACLVPHTLALFADDAYHIDYHHALVGLPKRDATFFHQPYAGSKASLLYTLSDKHVVGAVNPKDGALVWRHPFSPSSNGTHGNLRSGEGQDTLIGAVGDHIIAWSASDGRLVWESKSSGAIVEDLEILEQEEGGTSGDAKDALVLLNDATPSVNRLDAKTGRMKWTYQDTRCVQFQR